VWLGHPWVVKVISPVRAVPPCSDAKPFTYWALVALFCMICGLSCSVSGSAGFEDLFDQVFLGLSQLLLSLAQNLCRPLCVSRPSLYLFSRLSFFFFPLLFIFPSFFYSSADFFCAWRAFTALMSACWSFIFAAH